MFWVKIDHNNCFDTSYRNELLFNSIGEYTERKTSMLGWWCILCLFDHNTSNAFVRLRSVVKHLSSSYNVQDSSFPFVFISSFFYVRVFCLVISCMRNFMWVECNGVEVFCDDNYWTNKWLKMRMLCLYRLYDDILI